MARSLKDFFAIMDKKMSVATLFVRTHIGRYFPYVSSFLLLALFGIFIKMTIADRPHVLAESISQELRTIMEYLADIDASCNITEIKGDRCSVDFLTVERFQGSTLGKINLAYPDRWRGPYCTQNPSVQGRLYEIVKVKDGYLLVPGTGVELPNKRTMGSDIVIQGDHVVTDLTAHDGPLAFERYVLAQRLPFKIGDWDNPLLKNRSFEKIERTLEEFNEALSFSHASVPHETHTL